MPRISPTRFNVPFKPPKQIYYEKEPEQREEEKCTTNNMEEGFGEFKSVEVIAMYKKNYQSLSVVEYL